MKTHTRTLLCLLFFLLAGCSSTPKLMPTPNIYLEDSGYPEAGISPELKNSKVDLLFVTDRKPETDSNGQLVYGTNRSASLAFGSAMVEIGDDISWGTLVELSETSSRKSSPPISVVSRTELGRFPPTPHGLLMIDGEIQEDPEILAEYDKVAEKLRLEINRRMAVSGTNEVHIFVHGFKNSFDTAAVSIAEYWHFIGRRGVPMLYSWPAAHKGLFGYFVDRESGEFTIFHLKSLIRSLASFPEIERINIFAHSRGTDVATTALRELIIETRAAGLDPRERFRIENLILAAPDLDLDIVRQRLLAERIGPAFGQITVYATDADKALGLSQTLMSGTRFGRIDASDLSEREEAVFSAVKNVSFINVPSVRSLIGHGYYLSNPSTSSDIIRVITTGSKPGQADRPLEHVMLNFWEMPEGYPMN